MSHFLLMVIGENIEAQLQPFHEFECTGTDDRYVQDVDITADVRATIDEKGLDEALKWHGLDRRRVAAEAEVSRSGPHKYGFAVVVDGELVRAVDRTNPNKKWDYWLIGGRYSDRLLFKDGTRGDSGLVGDIDFKGMRLAAEERGRQWYESLQSALGDAPRPDTFATVRERHLGPSEKTNLDAARDEYWRQPAFVALRAHEETARLWLEEDEVQRWFDGLERVVDYYRRHAVSAFAVLKDGQWYERGEMGWWGIVSNEKDHDEWLRELDRLIESLSADTRITMVDCHI